MSGSGQFSRLGGLRSLNATLMSQGALQQLGGADIVGVVTTTVPTNTSTTAFAVSGGVAKQIPDNSIILTIPAAGTVASVQAWSVNGLVAAAGTTVTVDAQTTRTSGGAVTNGDTMALLSFTPYLSLVTSTPTGAALGTEYTATGYARQPIAWTPPTAADPPNAVINGTLTFGPTSSSPGTTITCGELMDNLTGGTAANRTAFWTWATPRTPVSGDSVQVSSGTGLSLSSQ